MDGGIADNSGKKPEQCTVRELGPGGGKTGGAYLDSRVQKPRKGRAVRSVAIALAIMMVAGAGLGVFSLVNKSVDKEKGGMATPMFMTHSPILIESEAALTVANGVTGGNGTAGNPFIIQGWDIDASAAAIGVGLAVSNTTSHLVIRNVNVHSGLSSNLGIGLINVTNCTVENSRSNDNVAGIAAMMCNHIVIQNNTVDDNQMEGILIFDSNYALIANNMVVDGWQLGVALFNSTGSSVVNNTMSLNSVAGLALEFCNGTTVSGNILEHNMQGLMVIMSDWSQIDHNKLFQNVNYGVFMMFSNNNTLFSNMIAETLWGSGFGMLLNSSTNNTIYHNDFLDGVMIPQAYDGSYGSPTNNRWNMSYPIGGNHWSDYSGSDTQSGPLQNIAGSDGVGDTPYDLFNSNFPGRDNYPLMTAPTFGDTPTAYFTVTPASGNPSTTFTFNATLSWEWSTNSTPMQFRWDFNGDGLWDTNWSTDMYIDHSYTQGGEYNVTMEVKDGAGNTDNMTWHVEVEPLVIPEFTTLLVPICSMIAIFLIVGALGRRR